MGIQPALYITIKFSLIANLYPFMSLVNIQMVQYANISIQTSEEQKRQKRRMNLSLGKFI